MKYIEPNVNEQIGKLYLQLSELDKVEEALKSYKYVTVKVGCYSAADYKEESVVQYTFDGILGKEKTKELVLAKKDSILSAIKNLQVGTKKDC